MTGTPHSADIKEWIIYQDPLPKPQSYPTQPHPPTLHCPLQCGLEGMLSMAAVSQQRKMHLPENKFSLDDFLTIQTNSKKQWKDFVLISKKTVLVSKENMSLGQETQI